MFNSDCCAAVEQSRHRQVLLRQTMPAHHDHDEQPDHQAGAPLPVSNMPADLPAVAFGSVQRIDLDAKGDKRRSPGIRRARGTSRQPEKQHVIHVHWYLDMVAVPVHGLSWSAYCAAASSLYKDVPDFGSSGMREQLCNSPSAPESFLRPLGSDIARPTAWVLG